MHLMARLLFVTAQRSLHDLSGFFAGFKALGVDSMQNMFGKESRIGAPRSLAPTRAVGGWRRGLTATAIYGC